MPGAENALQCRTPEVMVLLPVLQNPLLSMNITISSQSCQLPKVPLTYCSGTHIQATIKVTSKTYYIHLYHTISLKLEK